jgi:hypothetical protein
MSATGLSLSVNYLKGGQTFTSLAGVDGTDLLLFQKKPGGASGEMMFTCSILNAFNSIKSQGFTFEAYPEGSPPKSGSYFVQQSGSNSYSVGYDSVVQGIFDTYGVSTLNGRTGTIVFNGQGITFISGSTGITAAINYSFGGTTFALKTGKPQNADLFLIQEGGTGEMKTLRMSTLIAAMSQNTNDTSATYNAANSNFFIENTTNNNTERVSATTVVNDALSVVDGGQYSVGVP